MDSCYQPGHRKETVFQRVFDYTHENKCEQLFAENGKFRYTRSVKRAVVGYEEHGYCWKSWKLVALWNQDMDVKSYNEAKKSCNIMTLDEKIRDCR
jgi:hypothetical protein